MSVSVRMYRQGLGDCFLLNFSKADGSPFYVLIDCGVILGQPDAAAKMQEVVADLAATTGGHIDLLVGTHEHWDHLSGFLQAKDAMTKISFDRVWLAWTEDPHDAQAQSLAEEHGSALTALRASESRLRFYGVSDQADSVAGFLDFFGAAAAGGTTTQALDVVRELGKSNIRYCDPKDAPVELGDTGIKAYIMGPPRDEKLLKTLSKSANSPEMYGIDASALSVLDTDVPFDPMQIIPSTVAREMSFFKERYFGDSTSPVSSAPDWRRIDASFLDAASALALQLDSYTNNTSLVIAFERPNGDVMLFPGDAQIGSWLSWQTLSWTVDGDDVTGPDLLKRATFYKVGHHGSHNATAKASGLDQMKALRHAMIPVDHDEAVKKRWVRMPLPEIVAALQSQAPGGVIQADTDLPAGSTATANELYYELTIP